jgi:hypothetical protein
MPATDSQAATSPFPDLDAAPAPGDAKPAKEIRPIPPKSAKPRPALPGVDDVLPPLPATRDANGRFVKAAGEADAVAGDVPPPPDSATPPPAKFKFAGEEWETQDKAEQNFRTLRGMHKQLSAKETEARTRANEWYQEHQRAAARIADLERQLAGQKPGVTPAPAGAQPEAKSEKAAGIDWGFFKELQAEAVKAGQPEAALEWLMKENERILQERIDSLRKEVTEPQERAAATQRVMQHTDSLVTELGSLVKADGSFAYPELRDPEVIMKVGECWRELGLPPEQALSAAGLRAAVGLYRDVYGQAPTAAPAPTPAPSTPAATLEPRPAVDGADSDAAALAAEAGLGGTDAPFDRPAVGEEGLPLDIARLRRSLRSTPAQVSTLGFDR